MKSISRVILLSTVGLLAYGQNNNVFAAADILYPEQCLDAGYGVTACPAGSHASNSYPVDSRYYKECVCDASRNNRTNPAQNRREKIAI